MGVPEFKSQLEALGLTVTVIDDRFVAFKYVVPHGRFRDREIEIALEGVQFPLNPPSGPYIKPHIMPITNGGGVHPTGGIHERNIPTSDWQYWSRPYTNWNASNKDASDYMAFLRMLFDFE